jgi:hypothetical protein
MLLIILSNTLNSKPYHSKNKAKKKARKLRAFNIKK